MVKNIKLIYLLLPLFTVGWVQAQQTGLIVSATPDMINCGQSSTLNVSGLSNDLPVYVLETLTVAPLEEGEECSVTETLSYYGKYGNLYFFLRGYFAGTSQNQFNATGAGLTASQLEYSQIFICQGNDYTNSASFSGPNGDFVSLNFESVNFDYVWSHGLGEGTTKIVSPTATTTYTVMAVPTSGSSENTITGSVEVEVIGTDTQPIIGADFNYICADEGTGSTTLNLQGGTTYDRYIWTRGAITLPNNSATLIVNEIGTYRLQVEEGGCLSQLSDPIVIESLDLSVSISVASESCGAVELRASGSGGDLSEFTPYFRWYQGTSNVPFASGENLTTVTVTDTDTYRVKYFNYGPSSCGVPSEIGSNDTPSNSIPTNCFDCYDEGSITITIDQTETAMAGTDATVCANEHTLNAQALTSSTGFWTKLSGGGDAVFSNPASHNSMVTVSELGVYVFRWTVDGGANCPPSTDDVRIDFSGADFDIFIDNVCPSLDDPVVLNIEANQKYAEYTINWGDGFMQTTSNRWNEHYYSNQGEYQVTVELTNGPCTITRQSEVILISLCASAVAEEGDFKMDVLTGLIYFDREDCSSDIPFSCLIGPSTTIPRVVSAEAFEFSDRWRYNQTNINRTAPDNLEGLTNTYDRGERGRWRVNRSNTFKTDLTSHNGDFEDEKNYQYGTYDLNTFMWNNSKANTKKWIKSSRVLAYSPNGDALLERNPLNVNSIVKFGYYDALPIVTGANIDDLSTAYFESFEMSYETGDETFLEDFGRIGDAEISTQISHGGRNSLRLQPNQEWRVRNMKMTQQLSDQGLIVKFWAKSANDLSGISLSVVSPITEGVISSHVLTASAKSEDWYLMEVYLSPSDLSTIIGNLALKIKNNSGGDLWIDDVKFQPTDAQMTSYVYDKNNLRLLAVYDDRHFGLYYHYNGEGQLVRKMIETERGIKTIQETQYNISGE